jgi:hypothetical protein
MEARSAEADVWLSRVALALAEPGQPRPTFAALAEAMQALAGFRVMTVLRMDAATLRSRRLFSSEPSYPTGGEKQHARGAWSRAIIDERRHFVAATPDEIRATFPDHAAILATGCGAIVCLPVVHDGVCRATLNLWHEAGRYDDATAARLRPLAQCLIPTCL